jgi:hypothetical protein
MLGTIDLVSYHYINSSVTAVPWLRRLVAGLPPRRRGFDPGSVHVGFVMDKVALGQVFPRVLRFSPEYFGFPLSFHSTGASLLGEMKKTDHLYLHLHYRVAQ